MIPPANQPAPRSWHILAETSVPVAEFGLALSRLVPLTSWIPEITNLGFLRTQTRQEFSNENVSLTRVHFPLQRGFARYAGFVDKGFFVRMFRMLAEHVPQTSSDALICTSSFWAPVAELWKGPVVYYATDFTVAYDGLTPARVLAADRILCRVATLVCPNSPRLAEYFKNHADCDPAKLLVLPNATRAANILAAPSLRPAMLPEDVAHLRRPIAGVIGNMASNMDWVFLYAAMKLTPEYSWLLIGPTHSSVRDVAKRRARAQVRKLPHAFFAGPRPYSELFRYARALDVAIMPYDDVEPTYSGSATRFYAHLAAGRPILSSRGVDELLHKEPLLQLVSSPEGLAAALHHLKDHTGDSHEALRHSVSRFETWEARAASMVEALRKLVGRA